jgi:hypothetical protein
MYPAVEQQRRFIQLGEGIPERRKYKRYRAKKLTFAVVRSDCAACEIDCIDQMSRAEVALAVFKSKPAKMGQIDDLSLEGLSFSYIDDIADDLDESKTLDILFVDDNFFLTRLPFEIVQEYEIDDERTFSPITMRRRSVAFGNLTSDQRNKLDYFITSHTTGEARSEQ